MEYDKYTDKLNHMRLYGIQISMLVAIRIEDISMYMLYILMSNFSPKKKQQNNNKKHSF